MGIQDLEKALSEFFYFISFWSLNSLWLSWKHESFVTSYMCWKIHANNIWIVIQIRPHSLNMNTRYFFPSDSLCSSSTAVSYSSNPPPTEDRIARNRPAARGGAPSFLIRTAMRISRARWFNFLRRVFHYQNGSRSDLGSNPFNSSKWMTLELLALLIQITIITFTLSISNKESPIWPMRIWIVGYDIGCLLSLLLLYGRYRQLYASQGDGFSLPDVEQQRSGEDSRYPCNFDTFHTPPYNFNILRPAHFEYLLYMYTQPLKKLIKLSSNLPIMN